MTRNTRPLVALCISLGLCLTAGALGAAFTTPEIAGWYAALAKPSFNPPSWLFGPVWTTLYLLMGLAAFLVWNRGGDLAEVRRALILFIVQLVLNVLWSLVFFRMHSPLAGLIVLILLWLGILFTLLSFRRLSGPAAWLLAPYLAWVTFAGVLNMAIWHLNR